mmetsp:Transcript_16543/g.62913  ORF Transcript_16543/g.62913 Transcript_16543/m.62913 type:complete len:219 (+) Transcript_16543:175-831(+)
MQSPGTTWRTCESGRLPMERRRSTRSCSRQPRPSTTTSSWLSDDNCIGGRSSCIAKRPLQRSSRAPSRAWECPTRPAGRSTPGRTRAFLGLAATAWWPSWALDTLRAWPCAPTSTPCPSGSLRRFPSSRRWRARCTPVATMGTPACSWAQRPSSRPTKRCSTGPSDSSSSPQKKAAPARNGCARRGCSRDILQRSTPLDFIFGRTFPAASSVGNPEPC